ncbi:hypothetical protein NSK_002043 [Nannochloropsis salina CCMP1776]|uniref:Ran guanine nucleotide release factor n=1 Tax=Nannochloropsis salina CCMP1776 TaxID=1027361 RepID=A0A4D9D6F2_9STRA|nr:hypothetical protein NSK_002043 [Nannochloropsis salina CCMP1776]|eukprot:TFJ86956.1 hypothetical protein NSK_002043 [Nannochloropsis salina CCMP1776]
MDQLPPLTLFPTHESATSDIRQVPDNQEVFIDDASDASLILELLDLERDKEGLEAATYFFNDLAEHNDAQNATIQYKEDLSGTSLVPNLAAYPTYALIGTQNVTKFHAADAALLPVRIYLVNVRLQQTGTDVLLTLNLPALAQAPAAASFNAAMFVKGNVCPDSGMAALQEALASLTIRNWGLFG